MIKALVVRLLHTWLVLSGKVRLNDEQPHPAERLGEQNTEPGQEFVAVTLSWCERTDRGFCSHRTYTAVNKYLDEYVVHGGPGNRRTTRSFQASMLLEAMNEGIRGDNIPLDYERVSPGDPKERYC